MTRRNAGVNLRVKRVMGQSCPPMVGLASRDGCRSLARAREKGLSRHRGPRSGDGNDRTRNCSKTRRLSGRPSKTRSTATVMISIPSGCYPNNAGGCFGSPGKDSIYHHNFLNLSWGWRKNPFSNENLGTRGKMPGRNLYPMRCRLVFRIGRIRSPHHQASADELLIGFLFILLKFCHESLSLLILRGGPILRFALVQQPQGPKFPQDSGQGAGQALGNWQKREWEEKRKNSRVE